MGQRKRDYYEVLGIPRSAGAKDIKSAFRKLARRHHPDFNKNDKKAESRFKEANEAYAVLSNPEAKKTYDQFGHNQSPGQRGFDFSDFDFANTGGTFSGFGKTFRGGGFSDLFEELLGGGRRRAHLPRDTESEMQIEFLDAVSESVKTIIVEKPTGPQRISFSIPAGVKNGEKIRLRGKGLPGRGGTAGDLIIKVHIRHHPRFKREGNNIRVRVGISIAEAALGGKVSIPTPHGPSTITIPPGTQGGQVFRLGGKGIVPKKDKPGDLLATVHILVPKNLDKKSRELVREFDSRNPVDS